MDSLKTLDATPVQSLRSGDEYNTFCNALEDLAIHEEDPQFLPSFPFPHMEPGCEGDNLTTINPLSGERDDASRKRDSSQHHHHHQQQQQQLSDQQTQSLFGGDEDGDNLLHIGILHGNESVVFQIIQFAPDFTYLCLENDLRQTALHLAVLTRQSRITRRLICAGAEVNVPDRSGNTPLHLACALGYVEIVQQLLTPVEYEETLVNAYKIPFQRIPQNLNMRNYDGYNVLHLATVHRHVAVVRLLLDTGLDISYGHGNSGRSALHLASERGDMDILTLLVDRAGSLVDLPDFDGLTSFQLALGREHKQVKRLLLQNGAFYKTLDFEEDTDIDLSADIRCHE